MPYRVALLRDGVKSDIRVGRSRRAEGKFSEGCGPFMGPAGGRHVSDNMDADIGGADLFEGDCIMYSYTVNRGGMWIIAMLIVLVYLRIGRLLMCMIWPSCLGSVCLFRKWRTPQFIPGKVVRGCATLTVWVWDDRDRCHLCLIGQALMVAYSWLLYTVEDRLVGVL